ncbi:signal recognition particle-docking protein FtsY [soil metagenome]
MSTEIIVLLAVLTVLIVVAGAAFLTRARRPPVREDAPRAPSIPTLEPPGLRERLTKSRRFLADRLGLAFEGQDEETWEDLEAALIQSDTGVEVAARITADLRNKARERGTRDPEELKGLLAAELVGLFDEERERALGFAPEKPSVWMVVGVNGTGKTTTIGKLARDLTEKGHRVALAASDTFRAAADDQLAVWAERAGAHVVRHQPGADPGAVAFDAWQHAKARGFDVLIVDTAGRLHTKQPLMDELAKVRRVIEKQGQVDEVLLVLDAVAGQNGLVQARRFAEELGVTGIVLTKLDGTAKGGIAIAVEQTLDLPIKLIGVGEGLADLEAFDPKTFVDALLA